MTMTEMVLIPWLEAVKSSFAILLTIRIWIYDMKTMYWQVRKRENQVFSKEIALLVFSLVTHDLDNKRAWAPCFRVEGVKLPTGYYFGASAATGMKIKSTLIRKMRPNLLSFKVICLMLMTSFRWNYTNWTQMAVILVIVIILHLLQPSSNHPEIMWRIPNPRACPASSSFSYCCWAY